MHAYIRRALCAAGLAGGVVLLGIGLADAASADDGSGPVTTGESGIVSGNQTGVGLNAPVNVSGNQVTVIGQDNHVRSTGTSSTGSGSPSVSSGHPTTSGENGGGSGNQTAVDARAPINVSGNQVTVIGQDNTTQSAGSSSTGGTGGSAAGSPTTSGQNGIGSGNQTALGVQAPVNASGNQVTVIGQDNTVTSGGGSSTGGTGGGGAGSPTTSGENGILSGNQTGIDVLAPVDASGNQVTVIGQDNTVTSSGSSSTGGTGGNQSGGATTSGENGVGSGNQTGVTALVPVAATGNQVTVIGQDNTVTSTGGSTTGGGATGPGETTSGEGGVGSGNQTPIVVQAPVDTSGNQVTVIGQGNTDTSSSSSTSGGTTAGGTTPPGGTVSPPANGGTTGTPQAASGPGDTVLPNTGMSGGLLGIGLLGLLLLLCGLALARRGGGALRAC